MSDDTQTKMAANQRPRLARDELLARLRQVVSPRYVLHQPEELLLYEYDGSTLDLGTPEVVVVPGSAAEAAAAVGVATAAGWPVVARGAGTGLSGGSVAPSGGVVLATTRLDRIVQIDVASRLATVEAGVVNSDLSAAAARDGLHFAPDPSSQRTATIGGNVAENAGGPHCLKYGVTTNHVVAARVTLGDGSLVRLGSVAPDAPGYDLLGAFVGSEGTFGVAVELTVRLTPDPEDVQTFLASYDSLETASDSVSAIIAAGIIPAALEMLEGEGIRVVEESVGAGYPTDAEAVLLIEIDGLREELDAQATQIDAICRRHGAREVRAARDEAQRRQLWAGRKGALAACARIRPHYHILDGVVPRSRLTGVLRLTKQVAADFGLVIVNIFHAGDGNLHPLLLFDLREEGVLERAIAAGEVILRACVDAGGTISGEHGIGLEKRDYLGWVFSEPDLAAMRELREVFDPGGLLNPGKALPACDAAADLRLARGPARVAGAAAWI